MSHTYSCAYAHLVFSTKERRRTIHPQRRDALCRYIRGIVVRLGCELLAAGGTEDHIHLLVEVPPTLAISELAQKIKGSSSKWMGSTFRWQQGFGAFSVSASMVPQVTSYIERQEEHHKRRTFEDEFTALLKATGVAYDPRFVFG